MILITFLQNDYSSNIVRIQLACVEPHNDIP